MIALGWIMTFISQKLFLKRIVYKNLTIMYLYKILNLSLIMIVFGFSFKSELFLASTNDLDVGSLLIFVLSTVLLVLYNFTQKRKIDMKIYFLNNKSLSLFIIFLYMVMFGDFL